MSFPSICRVCLSSNRQMKIIADTKLQKIFEILTSNKLITNDGKPESVCFFCYVQLQKCWKFTEMARKSDMFLSGFLASQVQPTENNLINHCAVLRHDRTPDLSYTQQTFISIPNAKNILKESVKVEDEDKKYIEVTIKPTSTDEENEIKETKEVDQEPTDNADEEYHEGSPLTEHTNSDTENIKAIKPKSKKKNKPTFKCNSCPKMFRQKGYFIRHLRTHTGEKPYKCHICTDAFTDSVFLKQHLRTHSGEIPYICHICTKSFNHKPHFIEHIRTHTGEKPFSCDQCAYTFAHKGSLKRHMRIHSGEKPYMCHKCPRRFTQVSNLRKHSKTCQIDKKNICVKCSK